ncbi:hypothetical protein C8R32_10914 [Nitrosospira sp. Nsp5]|uniref:Uncharacterized protein n=1 Tax=Nitrosospira multiformis TaxID=1231 RepID=A0ABY0TI08_9PROT|nr:hypothetical protein C8R32_10914 [Nitrosospira sp. Nsp5]SDQ86787.1 hypothetical protein SAMN05216402_2610 [Nitrosospira multiformis]
MRPTHRPSWLNVRKFPLLEMSPQFEAGQRPVVILMQMTIERQHYTTALALQGRRTDLGFAWCAYSRIRRIPWRNIQFALMAGGAEYAPDHA